MLLSLESYTLYVTSPCPDPHLDQLSIIGMILEHVASQVPSVLTVPWILWSTERTAETGPWILDLWDHGTGGSTVGRWVGRLAAAVLGRSLRVAWHCDDLCWFVCVCVFVYRVVVCIEFGEEQIPGA